MEIFCEKCKIAHAMEIITVFPLIGKYSVEYRCKLTGFTIIQIQKNNPYIS